MKFNALSIGVFINLLLLIAGTVFAEEKPETSPIELNGTMYLNLHSNITDSTETDSGEKITTFEIERVYLTLKTKLNEIFSARVTADVSHDRIIENADTIETDVDGDGSEETVYMEGSETDKYNLYLKYAYIQAKNKIGPADIKFKAGLIDTPVIGFIDKMADQRWVHKNLLDDSKNLLPDGSSYDNSADMGASVDIDFIKNINLVFGVFNGEGYRKTNEEEHDTYEGKAYQARLTITPLNGLFISGFFRFEGTGANESDDNEGYMGAGLAWKSDLLMAGVNGFKTFVKEDGENMEWSNGDKKNQILIDSWLTVTPEKITGIPVFFMGRFGLGKDMNLEDSITTFIGAGIGYEFHEKVRTIVWYQQYDSEADDAAGKANPQQTVYLKAELSF
ncbi:MAG: hypothetical protein JW864_00085 [Spirochaetes bacterium]|nr:hypothetical protein [Spirochaetota bacterium]